MKLCSLYTGDSIEYEPNRQGDVNNYSRQGQKNGTRYKTEKIEIWYDKKKSHLKASSALSNGISTNSSLFTINKLILVTEHVIIPHITQNLPIKFT